MSGGPRKKGKGGRPRKDKTNEPDNATKQKRARQIQTQELRESIANSSILVLLPRNATTFRVPKLDLQPDETYEGNNRKKQCEAIILKYLQNMADGNIQVQETYDSLKLHCFLQPELPPTSMQDMYTQEGGYTMGHLTNIDYHLVWAHRKSDTPLPIPYIKPHKMCSSRRGTVRLVECDMHD
jgi:hypothetical protein